MSQLLEGDSLHYWRPIVNLIATMLKDLLLVAIGTLE